MVDSSEFMDDNAQPRVTPNITMEHLAQQPEYSQPDTATKYSPTEIPPPASFGLSSESARARAQRYEFAAKNLPEYQDQDKGLFTGKIINGQDDELRKQYAAYDALAKDRLNDDDTRKILSAKLPGEGITANDISRIQANSIPSVSNPKTVFEQRYAQEATQLAISQPNESGSHGVLQAQDESPSVVDLTIKYGQEAITKQQLVQKRLEEVQEGRKNASYLEKSVDFAMGFIPALSDVASHNALKMPDGSTLMPGDDMAATAAWYYSLPPDQAKEVLDRAVDRMGDNEITASFLQKLISYSSSDQWWDNFVSPAIDASIVLPGTPVGRLIGRVASKPFRAAKELAVTMKNTTAAVQGAGTTPNQILSALGTVTPAGVTRGIEIADEAAGNAPKLSTMAVLKTDAPMIFDAEAVLGGPTSSLSANLSRRLSTMLSDAAKVVQEDILGKKMQIDRTTGISHDAAVAATADVMRVQYSYANDSIIDIVPSTAARDTINVDFVEARIGENLNPPMPMPAGAYNPKLAFPEDYVDVVIGKTDAQVFDNPGSAANYAKYRIQLPDGSYKIKQLGDSKYVVTVTKPVDEVHVDARAALDIQTKNATPASIQNMYLGWLRGRSYVIPKEAYEDAVVATYGASALQKAAKAIYLPVGQLGKKEYNQFIKFLEAQRDYTAGMTGVRGKWSPNLGSLERDWMDKFGTMPSEKQVMAYYAHAFMNDLDWTIRNLSLYTAKSRHSVETFLLDQLGLQKAPVIEGAFRKELPLDSTHGFNFLILDEHTVKQQKGIYHNTFMNAEAREHIRAAIASGKYRVVNLTQDGEKALQNVPEYAEFLQDHNIDYIVVNSAKTKPLGLKHIPHRPGGHVEHTNGTVFLKQATIKEIGSGTRQARVYTGDKVVLAFDTTAVGEKFHPLYEKARQLYAGVQKGIESEATLKAFLEKNLPENLGEFKAMFNKARGGLDVNAPLHLVPKGKTVDDIHNLANLYKDDSIPFINRPRSEHTIMGPEDVVRYTGERDTPLLSVSEAGTKDVPIINFKPATLLDPASTMDQAIGSLMRGRYFDDFKYKYAEHFLSEFGDVLEPSFKDAIRDPFDGLINAKFKMDYPDRARLQAAKNYRRSVNQLLGVKSDGERDFDWLRQKIADSIYRNTGQKGLDLVAPYLLHRSVDAAGLLKQFAFHTKLGLFNPKQLFVQAAGSLHVAAIEGWPRALHSMGGAYLMSAAHFTKDVKILEELAEKAGNLGWKAEEWLESYKALERSGFAKVGREVALQDGLTSARLRDSSVGKVLDLGTTPFNVGERSMRYMCWNAAYLRWRGLNPGKTFTDKAAKEVLYRADLLTVNMSSAGNASWQKGMIGVTTQFFGYRGRLMEQVLGTQLTVKEKAHAFLTYAIAFGVPVASTIPVALWPVNNVIKDWMTSGMPDGYNADENMVTNFAKDGLGSLILQSIFGEDTNFETAIGPGPITQFHDLWQGKKSIAEIMGGASGSVYADIIASTTPLLGAVWDSMTDVKGPSNRITNQDLIDAVQPYTTANNAVKAVIALNYGNFYAKNQGVLVHVDNQVGAAILKGILGLDPQSLEDGYHIADNLEAIKDVKKKQEKEATKYYRLAYESMEKNDLESAEKYFERAGIAMDMGGFTPPERSRVMSHVLKTSKTTIESINWDLARSSEEQMKIYRRKQQNKGN